VRFLAESLEADFDVPRALSLAFGGAPPAANSPISAVRPAQKARFVRGQALRKPFKAVFDGGGGRLAPSSGPCALTDTAGTVCAFNTNGRRRAEPRR